MRPKVWLREKRGSERCRLRVVKEILRAEVSATGEGGEGEGEGDVGEGEDGAPVTVAGGHQVIVPDSHADDGFALLQREDLHAEERQHPVLLFYELSNLFQARFTLLHVSDLGRFLNFHNNHKRGAEKHFSAGNSQAIRLSETTVYAITRACFMNGRSIFRIFGLRARRLRE